MRRFLGLIFLALALLFSNTQSKVRNMQLTSLHNLRSVLRWEDSSYQVWLIFKVEWCPFVDNLVEVIDNLGTKTEANILLLEIDW